MLPPHPARLLGLLLARSVVLLGIVVLVCVPGLTRMGQKLETASHAPSFAKNIDCPPKRVTIAPVPAMASPMPVKAFETVPLARVAPPSATSLPPSPHLDAMRPLRAPPSPALA